MTVLSVLRRVFRWLIKGLGLVAQFLAAAWGGLAIYYSDLPSYGLRLGLALVFAAIAIWCLWIARDGRARLVFVVMLAAVAAWWTTIPPSDHRDWRGEVSVMPRVTITGDVVRISGVRNFEYQSRNVFTEHWETREYHLSKLTGLDFYVSYWKEGVVAHTFVSFLFEDSEPLAISIETRPEKGEGFDPLASLFKQFELIYVVGDERDIVGVRTNYRNETVYLYRLNASAEDARQLFLVYLQRINELADQPEFYNLLFNSCTINIIRYANAAGREGRFHLAHLLNGLIDSYLYHSGRVDTSLPFEELRRRSLINEAAKAADGQSDFSDRIRKWLPAPAIP